MASPNDKQFDMDVLNSFVPISQPFDLTERFRVLTQHVQLCAMELKQMRDVHQLLALKGQESQQLEAELNAMSLENKQLHVQRQQQLHEFLRNSVSQIMQKRFSWLEKQENIMREMVSLHSLVIDGMLSDWKSRQKLTMDRSASPAALDEIEKYCETLAELSFQSYNRFKEMVVLFKQLPLNESTHSQRLAGLQQNVLYLLEMLVTKTFIIVKEPPQIIQTNTKFSMALKLLVGKAVNGETVN